MVVPNRDLIEDQIVNWTLGDDLQRVIVKVGVAYGSDTALVQRLITEAAETVEEVKKDREILSVFSDFGNSSLDFELIFWASVRNNRERLVTQSKVRFEIDRLFRENGIQIPFPQRDIHLDFDQDKPLPVSVRNSPQS